MPCWKQLFWHLMFVAFVFARHVRPGSTFLHLIIYRWREARQRDQKLFELHYHFKDWAGPSVLYLAESGTWTNPKNIQSSLLTPSYARTRSSLDPCSQKQLFTHLLRKVIDSIRPPSSRHTAPSRCHGAVTVLSRCCHGAVMCSQLVPTCSQSRRSMLTVCHLLPYLLHVAQDEDRVVYAWIPESWNLVPQNYLSYCQPLNSKQRPPTVENPPWCQFQNIIYDIDVCIKLQLIIILLWEFDKYCWSQSFCWDPRRLINRKLIYRKGRPSI